MTMIESALESLKTAEQAATHASNSTSRSTRRFYVDLSAEMTARAHVIALLACAEAMQTIASEMNLAQRGK